jgi:hypothetical protein
VEVAAEVTVAAAAVDAVVDREAPFFRPAGFLFLSLSSLFATVKASGGTRMHNNKNKILAR